MTVLGLNVFDLAVLAVIALSGLFALMRGLVKEVLSIVSWIGALFAALYGYGYVHPFVDRLIQPAWLADAITGIGLFVITLIVLGLIASFISGAVRKSSAGAIDRSLGFLFGLLRGALIVCVVWLAMSWALPASDQPVWLKTARTLPLVERGANILLSMVPSHALPARANGRAAGTKAPDGDNGAGYNEGERRDMNRLIQAIE
jgi:membrane protein required for colicin V production